MHEETNRNGLHAHLVPLLIYFAAYYAFSYPALHTFATHLLTDGGDGFQNFWNNWWVRHAVSEGLNPWHTDLLFAPKGVTLIGATLNSFNGFMTVVLCTVVNPITAYNATVVLAFVVGGYSTFLLVRELTGEYWPAVFAGAVFTFCPYHFAHAMGHMQLVSLEWLPFFFFAWIRLLRRPGFGRAALAAVALFLNLLCAYYYALFAVVGGLILFVFRACLLRRPLFFIEKSTLLPLMFFAVLGLLCCGPFAWALLQASNAEPFHGVHDKDKFVNDLFALFVHAEHWRFSALTEWYWTLHPAQSRVESASHLGITVIVIALVGLFTSRRMERGGEAWSWFLIGVIFFAVSLGPTLLILGERYPGVPMPYDVLEVLPGFTLGGMPIRFSLMTNLAAAVLAGLGMSYLAATVRRKWIFVPLLAAFALEVWPQPQPIVRPEYPGFVEALRRLPPGSVAGASSERSNGLLYQTRFQKPMTDGYVARIPVSRQRYLENQQGLMASGHYFELLRYTEATYLVEDIYVFGEVFEPELKCVFEDDQHRIFTRRDNAIPEVFLTALDVIVEKRAGETRLRIRWERGAGRPYLCAFSRHRRPPVLLQDHRFGLVGDTVCTVSIDPKNTMFRNRGVFDEEGWTTVSIRTGPLLKGDEELWFSVIVFEESPPDRVHWISRPQRIVLTR